MPTKSDTSATGFELAEGKHVTTNTALGLLSAASIASFQSLGLKGCIHIEELCNNNFDLIVSSDTLRAVSKELLELADQADRADCNQIDIREAMDAIACSGDNNVSEINCELNAFKEHAHCLQMALLYAAQGHGRNVDWVKQQLSELTLDATLALIVNVHVPRYYSSALNQQLTNIPGFESVEKFRFLSPGPVPSQTEEVHRHYSYLATLVRRAAKAL
ncbi:hypothetical protein [Marinobacterium sp. BA1]|uniref:hypothetical protein n=1 Tax=Marinobacterium sp. BA1 TaxID=3138931 RepID=UPI0032E66309